MKVELVFTLLAMNVAKTILITGSTDGIGRLAAKKLVDMGHTVIVHGRSPERIQATKAELGGDDIDSVECDLSDLDKVKCMAQTIAAKYKKIDVLINNAGVYLTQYRTTKDGLDTRFVVNALAPYLLTKELISIIPKDGRVINLSSAAQEPVNLDALRGKDHLSDDFAVYAQSKLAITTWTRYWAQSLPDGGPIMIAVNPGSLLATKMVWEGFGVAGHDVNKGADILISLALDPKHGKCIGDYFDNDRGNYGPAHRDVYDLKKAEALVQTMDEIITPSR